MGASMRSGRDRGLLTSGALTFAATWLLPVAIQAQAAKPLTAPERTDFRETTRYADVVGFVETVAEASPLIHLTTFGYTFEGRALPLAVVGHVDDASPEAVRASGRTVVYVQGGIHSGEAEGKEVLLMLLRDIADGRHTEWLDSLVLLVAPLYNADGNERVTLSNRRGQNGPVGGMGQRPNAQGYDLNRDHMKLDSPEARSLAMLYTRYNPAVAMDLHTTNGTRHAYHLTYAPPLHPNTDAAIASFLRQEWLPEVTRIVREKYGWDYYYYGNAGGRGGGTGWRTFDHRPRFNNNYAGLRNRFGILSEAYAYATFEDRIKATRYFVEEIVSFAARNATEIRNIVARADAESLVGAELGLQAEVERSAEQVEILMGDVAPERNPYTGQFMYRRLDVRRPQMMYEYGTFRPTVTERVPRSYLIPAELNTVIDRLVAHGVQVEPLAEARTMNVEKFRIDSTSVSPREFQGHTERSTFGVWEPASESVPAGTLVANVEQPLGRLLFYLLEPRSDDGFMAWNLLAREVEGASHYSILRVRD